VEVEQPAVVHVDDVSHHAGKYKSHPKTPVYNHHKHHKTAFKHHPPPALGQSSHEKKSDHVRYTGDERAIHLDAPVF
jgi:hypothetical protein